ncbi:MAG: c-type cytochrome [Pseudobdellovibrio sp.]
MKKILNVTLLLVVSVGSFSVLSGCTDKSKPNVELIQDMMENPAIKSQEYDEASPNHAGMRVPPEGTQPQGFEPYKYATDIEGAAKNVNPIAGQFTEENLKTGIKYYTIHCAICHGAQGEGGEKLSVAETMALKPPAVTSDKIKGWTDGQIYHVITMGQGVMGPYASHIPAKYRWQVVNYIRHLQGKGN